MQRYSGLWWIVLLGCAIALASQVTVVSAKAGPDPQQLAAMADAIKYLQELDRYYSQVARPSPRSESGSGHQRELSKMENAIKMLQLQELDRFYAQRTRPRFGKRSEYRPVPDNAEADEIEEKILRQLVDRR